MKKKLLSIVVVLGLLFAPKVAQAATLQQELERAYGLCAYDSKAYATMCEYAVTLNNTKNDTSGMSDSEQLKALAALRNPSYSEMTGKIDRAYVRAVADKKINLDNSSISTGAGAKGAETCGGSNGVSVSIGVGCDGSSSNPIYDYLKGIIRFVGGLIGVAIVLTFIISGIQYAASSGEPANIAKAKDRIFNAVLGLILYIMLAAVIRYLLPNVFTG